MTCTRIPSLPLARNSCDFLPMECRTGYAPDGLPLYRVQSLQRARASILLSFRAAMKNIMENEDSRQIFYFLCINFGQFCFSRGTYLCVSGRRGDGLDINRRWTAKLFCHCIQPISQTSHSMASLNRVHVGGDGVRLLDQQPGLDLGCHPHAL